MTEETIYHWNVLLMLEYVHDFPKMSNRFRNFKFLIDLTFLSFHSSNRIAQNVLKLLE